jgi:hypothetical protein
MKKILFLAVAICVGASAYNIENRVNAESSSHQKRIGILEIADECIKNAKSDEDFKKCEQNDEYNKDAHKDFRFDIKKQNILTSLNQMLLNYKKETPKYTKLSEFRNCVGNAVNADELKECRKKK